MAHNKLIDTKKIENLAVENYLEEFIVNKENTQYETKRDASRKIDIGAKWKSYYYQYIAKYTMIGNATSDVKLVPNNFTGPVEIKKKSLLHRHFVNKKLLHGIPFFTDLEFTF